MSRPPASMRKALRRCLPPGSAGDTILGDLHEEYDAVRPAWARDVWYLAAALRTLAGYYLSRDRAARSRTPGRRPPAAPGRPALPSPGGRARRCFPAAGQELRHAVRTLWRQPAHSGVAVVTLALGICATTSIFSIINGALLQPLPYREPERLLRVGSTPGGAGLSSMSLPNVEDLRSSARGLSAMTAYQHWWFNISSDPSEPAGDRSVPARVSGLRVEPHFLEVLGVRPRLGRDLVPDDASETVPVVIIGDRLWRSRFGSDPRIIGRQVLLDLVPRTVIGVLPPQFAFLRDPQVVIPLPETATRLQDRRARQVDALARLAHGITPEAGVDELRSLYATLEERYPESNEGWSVAGVPALEWRVRGARPQLLLFAGAVALVLAVACTNVANLSLVRAEARRGELSVRAALGAGRSRLVRLLVLENVVLGLAGAAVAALATPFLVRLLVDTFARSIPRAEEVVVDGRVLLFAIALGVTTGAVVGVVAALQIGRGRLAPGLGRSGGGATSRRLLRETLVVVEVTLAVVLVSGAGLLLGSVSRLRAVDLGVDERGVLTFAMGLPAARYTDPEAMNRFWDGLVPALGELDDIEFVGLTTRQPLNGGTNGPMSLAGGSDRESRIVEARAVTPGYFRALGMELLAGRMINVRDRQANGAVVVNEAFARALVDDGDVIGEMLAPEWTADRFPIVGVVSDVRDFGPTQSSRPTVYWHIGAGPIGINAYLTATIRTAGEPMSVLPAVRDRIHRLDPDIPLVDIATLEELAVAQLGGNRRSALSLLSAFAILATMLGAIGIYAVMSFGVTQRTREVGVRVALGATPSSVQRLIVAGGLRLAAIGIVCGSLLSVASGAVLESMLYEVAPGDPAALAAVAGVMLAASLLACWRPARRASRIEVVEALRR